MKPRLETLTAEDHHEYDEDFLGLRERRDVTESDTGHAGQREVERGRVGHRAGRSAVVDYQTRGISHHVVLT